MVDVRSAITVEATTKAATEGAAAEGDTKLDTTAHVQTNVVAILETAIRA